MDKVIKYLKSIPWHIWASIVIMLVGIFFRTYNFYDWMSFNTDGVRDSILVSHPIEEGIGSLPLLGPRAGGTQLHLGPIFYYFEYLAGAIFQSTNPVVFAFPTLLFSIITIPLFFLLLREYFSPKASLIMTAMFATCFMAIEYSRFAWNPNATPFFTILFFLALLRAYNSEKKRILWFAVSGGSLAIATQLHFSAFLGLPIIFVLFTAINWKKTKEIFSWKSLLAFFGTIFVLYLPVFIFEFLTHGKNTKLFFDAIDTKGSSHTVFEKIIRDIGIFSKYFLWIIAGIVDGKKWQEVMSALLLFAGTGVNLFLIIKEIDEKKKRFLSLSFIFILTFFVLYIPLAFDIKRSRFFLPVIIVPFMLTGYLIAFARHMGFKQKGKLLIAIIIAVLIFGNVSLTLDWFSNMNMSQTGIKNSSFEKVSEKNKEFWWTWGRLEGAADYMKNNCNKKQVFFIISRKTGNFGDAIEYAFFMARDGRNLIFKQKYKQEYEKYDSCYYYISLDRENLPDFLQQKKYDSPSIMGDMKIVRWYPEIAGTAVFPPKKTSNRDDSLKNKIKSDYPRILWRDLFR